MDVVNMIESYGKLFDWYYSYDNLFYLKFSYTRWSSSSKYYYQKMWHRKMGFPNFANKTFANWTFANWRKSARCIGESTVDSRQLAKVSCTFASWQKYDGLSRFVTEEYKCRIHMRTEVSEYTLFLSVVNIVDRDFSNIQVTLLSEKKMS
jgi:hypothetical protein